jgi:hypothetical protein
MNNDNNTNCDNMSHPQEISPIKKKWMMAQYQRLINLIPHGKHKKQKGTKGAFGNRKRLASK